MQALAVLMRLEDLAFISAFAFEDTGGIMEAMRQDVNLGVAPGHHLAVKPYKAVAIVKRQNAHQGLLQTGDGYRVIK
jgi:hypothetical protein